MTDIKAADTGEPDIEREATAFDRRSDRIARATVLVVFAALAFFNLLGISRQLPLDSVQKALTVAAIIANVMFLSLIAATALTRLTPISKAKGIEPRIAALLGTFLTTGLAMFPKA